MDPLSTGLNRSYSNKTGKKSLASRISNQLGRFKRSSSADKSQSRIVNHVPNQPVHQDGFSPHFRPRRTFYNVLPPREVVTRTSSGSMRGPSSRRYFVHPPVSASVTPSWATKDSNGPSGPNGSNPTHYHHRPMCVDLDNTVAINGNVCLCEGYENSGGRLCRRCGLERQAVKAKVESWWKDWISDPSKAKKNDLMKRSQSEESVSTTNPYEAMRKQRLSASTNMQGRYVSGWNDGEDSSDSEAGSEDEEDKARAYAEVDLIYNSVRRRPPPMHSMAFQGQGHMPSPYVIEQPGRLQRSSSSVIRRSIILKTPSSGKILPTPPRGSATPTSTSTPIQQQTKTKSSATVYVAPEPPQPNNTVVKINMNANQENSTTESSAKGMNWIYVKNLNKISYTQQKIYKKLPILLHKLY